jgi:hypothetical protein
VLLTFAIGCGMAALVGVPAHAADRLEPVRSGAGVDVVDQGVASEAAKPRAPRPKVTKVRPRSGPTAGGTRVVIKGKNFTKVKKVTFGRTKARVVKAKKRKLVVLSPARRAGVVPVRVKTKAGRSKVSRKARFTYVGAPASRAPVVTALTPNAGPTAGGTAVRITGTNLTGATAVSFGGTPAASFVVQSATSIQAVSPARAAGPAPVTVTTAGGTSAPVAFTYQAPTTAPPVVVLVSPLVGPAAGGTAVTITGSGFTGATAVTIGGTAATSFTVDSDTTISATTPAGGPGPAAVSVTTPAGTSAVPGLFTYLPLPPLPPVVLLVAPLTGPVTGGTAVTITGTGFTGATAVEFDGVPATSFTVDSDTTISATTPAHAAGPVGVSVTTPAGSSVVPGLFTYLPLPPLPLVLLVTPALGPSAGGTTVTITGSGFTGATAVSFGGTPATSFTVDSDISISAVTPPHATGLVNVAVTTPGGTFSGLGLFLYL